MEPSAGEPQSRDAYVVQLTNDGIPEAPEVYFDRAVAERTFVEFGVRNDLPFDPERGDFDNSEAHHVEVRLYHVGVPYEPDGAVALTEEQQAEVARILALGAVHPYE